MLLRVVPVPCSKLEFCCGTSRLHALTLPASTATVGTARGFPSRPVDPDSVSKRADRVPRVMPRAASHEYSTWPKGSPDEAWVRAGVQHDPNTAVPHVDQGSRHPVRVYVFGSTAAAWVDAIGSAALRRLAVAIAAGGPPRPLRCCDTATWLPSGPRSIRLGLHELEMLPPGMPDIALVGDDLYTAALGDWPPGTYHENRARPGFVTTGLTTLLREHGCTAADISLCAQSVALAELRCYHAMITDRRRALVSMLGNIGVSLGVPDEPLEDEGQECVNAGRDRPACLGHVRGPLWHYPLTGNAAVDGTLCALCYARAALAHEAVQRPQPAVDGGRGGGGGREAPAAPKRRTSARADAVQSGADWRTGPKRSSAQPDLIVRRGWRWCLPAPPPLPPW